MTSLELQSAWRSLIRIFPVWKIPIDILFSQTTWRFFGADLLGGPFRDRKSKAVASILAPLSPEMVSALEELANINVRRTSAAFAAVAVIYVSLPLTIGALVSEVAPDVVRTYIFENVRVLGAALLALAFGPVIYFGASWRARQLLWTMELVRAGAIPAPLARQSAASAAESVQDQASR